MVESVDTQDLKSCGGNPVRVQVPLLARIKGTFFESAFFHVEYLSSYTSFSFANSPCILIAASLYTFAASSGVLNNPK